MHLPRRKVWSPGLGPYPSATSEAMEPCAGPIPTLRDTQVDIPGEDSCASARQLLHQAAPASQTRQKLRVGGVVALCQYHSGTDRRLGRSFVMPSTSAGCVDVSLSVHTARPRETLQGCQACNPKLSTLGVFDPGTNSFQVQAWVSASAPLECA